jgi:hypothetical protein
MPIDFTDQDFQTDAGLDFSDSDFEDKPAEPKPVTGPLKLNPYEEAELKYPGIGQRAMGSGTEFTTELAKGIAQLPEGIQKGFSAVMAPIEDFASRVMNQTAASGKVELPGGPDEANQITAEPGEPLLKLPLADPREKGIIPSLSRAAAGFTTPGNIATLPLAGASKLVQGAFLTGALANIPEGVKAAFEAQTPEEVMGAVTDTGINAALSFLIGRHINKLPRSAAAVMKEAGIEGDAYASQNQKAAEVHGNVRPLEKPAEGLPAQESGPGIQPSTQAQQTEILLKHGVSEADAAHLDAERKAIDSPIDVIPEDATEGQPFAGQFSTIDRANGRIKVFAGPFKEWLDTIKPENRQQAIKSLLSEERLHLAVDDTDAAKYWDSLSGAEKMINNRRYSGNWQGINVNSKQPISPTLMGHEALRFRLQQLSRMTPREIAEASGFSRLGMQGLTALESIARKLREVANTKGSAEGKAIADRILGNLGALKVVMQGEQPSAIRKGKEKEAAEMGVVDEETRSHIPVTIERPDGTTYQGQFNGYYDLREIGGGLLESIGRLNEKGDWTHGGLYKGEKVLTKLPTVEQWKSVTRNINEAETPSAIRKEGAGPEEELSKVDKTVREGISGWLKANPEAEKSVRDYARRLFAAVKEQYPDNYKDLIPTGIDPVKTLGSALNAYHRGTHNELIAELVPFAKKLMAENPGLKEAFDRQIKLQDELISSQDEPYDDGYPSAIRKKKGGPQTELYLPPLPKGKQAERTVDLPPGANAMDIQKVSLNHLQSGIAQVTEAYSKNPNLKAKPPTFQTFKAKLKNEFGGLSENAIKDAFHNSIWTPLMNASGQTLEALRNAYSLKNALGAGKIADPAARTSEPLLQGEAAADVRAQLEAERKSKASGQKYRSTVISAIGRKLMESEGESAKLTRAEIDPTEIDFEAKSPAWYSITTQDTRDPKMLGNLITQDARQSGENVSATKRVTVLQNRETGKIDVVSTYRDPRRGAVLLDPQSPGKTHGTLESILKRFRPIYSALLKSPVKDFRMSFDSLGDFERQFGQYAKQAQDSSFVDPTPVEGEFQTSGSGGKVATSGIYLDRPGTLEEGESVPLTSSEAASVLDHVLDEFGTLDSPDEVKASLMSLGEVPKAATRSRASDERHRQALSGFRKLFAALEKQDQTASVEELLDRLANQVYENHKNSPSFKDFIARTVAQAGPAAVEALKGESQPPAIQAPGGKELTMPINRVPPTTVRPEQVPHGTIPEHVGAPELTEAHPGEVIPPEMLSEADLKAVREQGEQKYPGERDVAPPQKESPGAILKRTKEEWDLVSEGMANIIRKNRVEKEMPALRDGAENLMRIMGSERARAIELASQKPIDPALQGIKKQRALSANRAEALEVRRAAKAKIAAGFFPKDAEGNPIKTAPRYNKNKLAEFERDLRIGHGRAEYMATSPNPFKARAGRAWLKAIAAAQKEIEYARANWTDPRLNATVDTYKSEMGDQLNMEQAHGSTLSERENYIPGLFEGQYFGDNWVLFPGRRLLGSQYRLPKRFANPYEALREGPYILASGDIAALAEHRVNQGLQMIGAQQWVDSLRGLKVNGFPVAKDPKVSMAKRVDPVTGDATMEQVYQSPSPEYTLVYPRRNGRPVAILRGLDKSFDALTASSKFENWPAGKAALATNQLLKHGVLLMLDVFHFDRLLQYAYEAMGFDAGYKGGVAAVQYRLEQLPAAVERGEITAKAAAWASERIPVKGGTGTLNLPRTEVARMLVARGLNASRISDALYKDAVRQLPIIGEAWHRLIGPYNQFLFNRFVPGIIVETAVRNFEKYQKQNTGLTLSKLLSDVAKDTNIVYGNMGRQGIIGKDPTWRDFTQTLLLAPNWLEGLIRKDLVFASRVTGLSKLMGRQGPYLGVAGGMMGKGLLTYAVLTQVINLITRGKPTWKNEEEGHKWDAYLPVGETGVWLSPLSVFGEITHDLIRLSESKATTWDAVRQIGENKLSPIGKMLLVLGSGETPQGRKIGSTAGVLGNAASQLAVSPISFGVPARALAHRFFPNQVSPPPAGALFRQIASSGMGIKLQQGQTAIQEVSQLARTFMQKEGLVKDSGWTQIMTDDPNYSKLRTAVKLGDVPEAIKQLKGLQKTHTDQEIFKAMGIWAKKGFTGSKKNERMFLYSLSDRDLDLYNKAMEAKYKEYSQFLDFYIKHAEER